MSIATIRQRVAKLERAMNDGLGRHHVFEAHSPDEAKCKEAYLIAAGAARPNDLFIAIRRMPWLMTADNRQATGWNGRPA